MAEHRDPLARSCGSLSTCKWTGSDITASAVERIKIMVRQSVYLHLTGSCANVTYCIKLATDDTLLVMCGQNSLMCSETLCGEVAYSVSKLETAAPQEPHTLSRTIFGLASLKQNHGSNLLLLEKRGKMELVSVSQNLFFLIVICLLCCVCQAASDTTGGLPACFCTLHAVLEALAVLLQATGLAAVAALAVLLSRVYHLDTNAAPFLDVSSARIRTGG